MFYLSHIIRYFAFVIFILHFSLSAQTGRLVLNNNPYFVFEPASVSYLVINNTNADAIRCMPSGDCYIDGRIISQSENNKVKWAVQTTIGDYIIPFYYSTAMVPFRFNKTTTGTEAVAGDGCLTACTWYTSANAVWPTTTSLCGFATEDDVVDRFWVIDVLGYSANPTATMRFSYRETPEKDGSYPEADLQAQRWNTAIAGTCKWDFSVGTDVPADNYVEVITSDFSPWALTNKSVPLPIELLSFTGNCNIVKTQNFVSLQWETASEINNNYFSIERSIDEQTFKVAGTKQGAGNSSTPLNYDFVDKLETLKPETILYYRLKQTDFDGNYSYSKIIAVLNCDTQGITQIESVYNNSNGTVTVIVYSKKEMKYNIAFYDAIGRKIIDEKLLMQKGKNTYLLNSRLFSTGVYLIRLYNDFESIIYKTYFN